MWTGVRRSISANVSSQCLVLLNNVATENHALLREPDQHIPGRMSTAAVLELECHATHSPRRIVALYPSAWECGDGAVCLGSQYLAEAGQLVAPPSCHVSLSSSMRQNLRSLAQEISVAKPAMVLPAGVDHPFHRLAGNASNGIVNLARSLERCPAVN
jgi:hypothetical protein